MSEQEQPVVQTHMPHQADAIEIVILEGGRVVTRYGYTADAEARKKLKQGILEALRLWTMWIRRRANEEPQITVRQVIAAYSDMLRHPLRTWRMLCDPDFWQMVRQVRTERRARRELLEQEARRDERAGKISGK